MVTSTSLQNDETDLRRRYIVDGVHLKYIGIPYLLVDRRSNTVNVKVPPLNVKLLLFSGSTVVLLLLFNTSTVFSA